MESKANHIDVLYPDDLLINHSGHLSERQRRGLVLRAALWLGVAGLDVLFFVFLIYFQIRYQICIFGYFLLCAFLIPVAWRSMENAKPFQEDLRNDEVKSIAGQIYKKASISSSFQGRTSAGYCAIGIDHQVFSVSSFIYDAIMDDGLYRLYFLPNSRTLINFEHLRD